MKQEEVNDSQQEQVFAFDVPLDLPAHEAAKLIDFITPEGFYPWQAVMWPNAGLRVFCKRSKASKPGELSEARRKADAAKDAEDARAEAALIAILKASPRITTGVARVRLGRQGFRRCNDWVKEALTRVR